MMSTGMIKTPVGSIEPHLKIHNNQDRKELPEGTAAKPIAPGWNTFEFNGQSWKKHPANGINWNLYTYTSGTSSFSLAHWGTTWQNTHETTDFYQANQKDYQEDQQIIRIKYNNVLSSVIIPQWKGALPMSIKSSTTNSEFKVSHLTDTVQIFKNGFYLKSHTGEYYTLFGSLLAIQTSKLGLRGGSMQLEIHAKKIMCYLHGSSGIRSITFPYKVSSPVYQKKVTIKSNGAGSTVSINYVSSGLDVAVGNKPYELFTLSRS